MATPNSSKWPQPPQYYLTGGPWHPPPIPTSEKRIWQTFSMALDPPCTVVTNALKQSSSSASSTTTTTTNNHLRDVNLGDFSDIVLELRRKYAELVWALSRMDSSKEEGYDAVTKSIDLEFVKAQSIIEDYHPKLALLETLEALKAQVQRRKRATERLVESIGRASDDVTRASVSLSESHQ